MNGTPGSASPEMRSGASGTSDAADSWLHEKESAWLYRRVARAEPDSRNRQLFEQLAAAAEEQATRWEAALRRQPAAAALKRTFRPSTRARVVARLVAWLGPRAMHPVLAAMKLRGLSVYSGPAVTGHDMPTKLAQVGQRHRGGLGANLRATVFGVDDGLISNASLVMGIAGAGASPALVLITGLAGLLAGALSMSAGEYVSVRSQREMYEYQIALERAEIAEYPEEEAEELALIYQARGMELAQAREVSQTLLSRPDHALDVLAREELGLSPDMLGSPWGAAGASFLSFAFGAAVPVLPFLTRLARPQEIVVAAVLTLLTLFGVGLAISLFTGRDALRGALRMVLIGGGAGALSFLVGHLLRAAIH